MVDPRPSGVPSTSALSRIWPRWRNRRFVDSLERIDSFADWAELFARPGHHTVARTETVKFLIDLEDDNHTYFIDSKKWELHFYFVRQYLDTRALIGPFHVQEYTRDDRRYVLGSVMHYLDGDHWTIELAGGDTLDPLRIAWMFNHIRARIHIPATPKFRPVSPAQIEKAHSLTGRIPVLSSDSLNASITYQPIVLGTAFGYLRLLRGDLDVSGVRPNDIVVTEQVPEQIPPVAGLITSQLQAPLAHVAVLSRNRNTPDMALRGAIDLPALRGRRRTARQAHSGQPGLQCRNRQFVGGRICVGLYPPDNALQP